MFDPPECEGSHPELLVLIVGQPNKLTPAAVAQLLEGGTTVVCRRTTEEALAWLKTNYRQSIGWQQQDCIQFGPLEIEADKRLASWKGRPLELTHQEFEFMMALSSCPAHALSFTELNSIVWGDTHRHDTDRVRSMVTRLRHKLLNRGIGLSIESARGWGYRLDVEPADKQKFGNAERVHIATGLSRPEVTH
jgi:DNA-binding response OmpR family regulator